MSGIRVYKNSARPSPLVFEFVDVIRAVLMVQRVCYLEFGQIPIHYLAGWKTIVELTQNARMPAYQGYFVNGSTRSDGSDDGLRLQGVPIYHDPFAPPHSVRAVPRWDYCIGREMPPGLSWVLGEDSGKKLKEVDLGGMFSHARDLDIEV